MVPQKNVALEPEVFARVAAEAQKEGRTPDELANEAAKRFLTSRRLQDLQQYGRQRAADMGLTEDDVARLISESRAERRR
jgi:hypothetical protein